MLFKRSAWYPYQKHVLNPKEHILGEGCLPLPDPLIGKIISYRNSNSEEQLGYKTSKRGTLLYMSYSYRGIFHANYGRGKCMYRKQSIFYYIFRCDKNKNKTVNFPKGPYSKDHISCPAPLRRSPKSNQLSFRIPSTHSPKEESYLNIYIH